MLMKMVLKNGLRSMMSLRPEHRQGSKVFSLAVAIPPGYQRLIGKALIVCPWYGDDFNRVNINNVYLEKGINDNHSEISFQSRGMLLS